MSSFLKKFANLQFARLGSISLLAGILIFPVVNQVTGIYFVDQRYQALVFYSHPAQYFISLGLTLLIVFADLFCLKDNNINVKTSFLIHLPLLPLFFLYRFKLNYTTLLLTLYLLSCTAARVSCYKKNNILPEFFQRLNHRKCLLFVVLIWLIWSNLGSQLQIESFRKIAMQWFDWGHFFEILNNFFKGQPFHLNLVHGNFLGSRFCPTMILLLPVAATQSIELFFIVGSLLVGSGAILIFYICREIKFSPLHSAFFAIWYLLIPGIINMNMPLLDGFHEVFLLFPLFFGTILAYLKQRRILMWLLIILMLGVRETVGFMIMLYGIVLWIKGQKRFGIALFATGLISLILIIGLIMPVFNSPDTSTYVHTCFYASLGNSITEIAMSPLLKPSIFWSKLFSLHSLNFWLVLFLPFFPIILVGKKIYYLIAILLDLLMVTIDDRFDSQTVLRHYQIVMLLGLVVFVIANIKAQQYNVGIKILFAGLKPVNIGNGLHASLMTGALLGACLFTQIPGLPASDPRLKNWSYGTEILNEIYKKLPPGANVTAGPRLASLLVTRNEIFFDYQPDDNTLQNYVLIENFTKMYQEDKLSRYLLKSADWLLIYQGFLDERSIQLFKKREPGEYKPNIKPDSIRQLSSQEWEQSGIPIPSPLSDISLRAQYANDKTIVIYAKVNKEITGDLGFNVFLSGPGIEKMFFTSFGDGKFPADFAAIGDVYSFRVSLPGNLTQCRVDIVRL